MKTRETRKEEAEERQKIRNQRSAQEQLQRLDQKLGKNVGAKKERVKLTREVQNGIKNTTKN